MKHAHALIGSLLMLSAMTPVVAFAHTDVFLDLNLGRLFWPPAVSYAPPPVYYTPPVVVYQPAPAYYSPSAIYYGDHDDQGDHRHWRDHNDWRNHRDWDHAGWNHRDRHHGWHDDH
ncbi:MAG TPA: hypothetical protein VFQ88_12170 [Nevskiaceae bacterium]|nr:hypothetical protein [Nevskiaceae bacterium]